MKKFFYVALVSVALFAAKSCKEPEPEQKPAPEPVTPPPPTPEDSSGLCKIIFQNIDDSLCSWNFYVDNKSIKESMFGGRVDSTIVQAGTRTLYAEQILGIPIGEQGKKKKESVKILTDSVLIWQFP